MPGHDSRAIELPAFGTISTTRRAARDAGNDLAERIEPSLDDLVPADSMVPYDIKDAIHAIADDRYFFEVQEHFAKNLVIGFARLEGRPVGIVANQPAVLSGVLDISTLR